MTSQEDFEAKKFVSDAKRTKYREVWEDYRQAANETFFARMKYDKESGEKK